MQYPFIIFTEYKINSNPVFYKTRDGQEYSVFYITKSFKCKDGSYIKDSSMVQCYGDENQSIRRMIEKYKTVKGLPVDISAERIPYVDEHNKSIAYSFRAAKVSVASSYYYENGDSKKSNEKESINPIASLEMAPYV